MESREGSPKAGGTPAGQIAGRGGREGPLSPWPFRQGWPCSGSLWLSLSGEAGLELPPLPCTVLSSALLTPYLLFQATLPSAQAPGPALSPQMEAAMA